MDDRDKYAVTGALLALIKAQVETNTVIATLVINAKKHDDPEISKHLDNLHKHTNTALDELGKLLK
jgi:riboflavin synthase